MIPPPPTAWPGLDGIDDGCREQPQMLAGNYAEVAQVPPDALLMGVGEPAMRQVLAAVVAGIESPKRPR